MTPPVQRVVGIDTALRTTGYGVLEQQGTRLRSLGAGIIRNPPQRPVTQCLAHLFAEVGALLAESRPQAVAVEGVFAHRNARTLMLLGQARGAVLTACARAEIPVFEYAPRRVKQAVTGAGGADKLQVAHMVMRLLGLEKPPSADAADALALALCHLHHARLAGVTPGAAL